MSGADPFGWGWPPPMTTRDDEEGNHPMGEGVSGADDSQLPALVVVSGPAGSGKTNLAHTIAQRLGVPAVVRDEIKQGMVLTAGQTVGQGWDELNMPTSDGRWRCCDGARPGAALFQVGAHQCVAAGVAEFCDLTVEL